MITPGIEVRELRGDHERVAAHELLYRVYHREQGWVPPAGNPSGLALDHERSRLTDDLERVSTWYGAFDGERLVGCIRACGRQDGRFELERYRALPEWLTDAPAVEINRLAVSRDRRGLAVLPLLLRAAARHAVESDSDYVFATMPYPRPGRILEGVAMRRPEDAAFRYHPDDPEAVWLFVADRIAARALAERTSRTNSPGMPMVDLAIHNLPGTRCH